QGEKDHYRSVTGITSIDGIALLNIEGNGMVGIPGFSKRCFEALFHADINVVLITQASSEHSICIAVKEDEAEAAREALDEVFEAEILNRRLKPVTLETGIALVALVG